MWQSFKEEYLAQLVVKCDHHAFYSENVRSLKLGAEGGA